MEDRDEIDEMIDWLIEIGALIEHRNEATGEVHYEVSPDSERLAPGLWTAHVEDLRAALFRQWQHGMIDIVFSADGPMHDLICITEDAYDEEKVALLPEDDQYYLRHIKRVFDMTN